MCVCGGEGVAINRTLVNTEQGGSEGAVRVSNRFSVSCGPRVAGECTVGRTSGNVRETLIRPATTCARTDRCRYWVLCVGKWTTPILGGAIDRSDMRNNLSETDIRSRTNLET